MRNMFLELREMILKIASNPSAVNKVDDEELKSLTTVMTDITTDISQNVATASIEAEREVTDESISTAIEASETSTATAIEDAIEDAIGLSTLVVGDLLTVDADGKIVKISPPTVASTLEHSGVAGALPGWVANS